MRILVLLLCLACLAATYYVSPAGNNTTGNGTSGNPWQTIAKGISSMTGGDTLVLQDGTYTERNGIATSKNGTAGSPTVFRAVNPLMVTNIGGFTVSQGGAGYIEFRGIVFQDGTPNPNWEGILHFYHNSSGAALGAGYEVSNCWFVGIQDPTSHNIIGLGMDVATNAAACAANFQLLNCVFTNTSQYSLSIMASNGLVANCRFDFANSHDAVHIWGANNWISNCVFTNISPNPLVADHTDCIQYWSQNSAPVEATNLFICNNLFINCGAQPFQIEWDTEANGPPFTAPVGGLFVFNNVFENLQQHGSIDIQEVHFYNNLFANCRMWVGSTLLSIAGPGNNKGCATNCSFFNNIFYNCGNYTNNSGNPEITYGYYDVTELGLVPGFTADYNYVCGTNFSAKKADVFTLTNTVNLHSINGGNPYFRSEAIGDFHLNKNSPLIDAGAAIVLFSNDYDHSVRPQGSGWDIGPYEFDPSLLVLLNPATDFSGGVLSDLTGNGHDGKRFSNTNWPYATNLAGRAGANFTVLPGNLLEPPTDSGFGDYIAITNLSSITLLTNGTLSMWARYYQTQAGGTNWNEATSQRLFDAGYQGMTWSGGAFFIGRGYDPVSGDVYHTVMRRYTTDGLANPTTLFAFPDGSIASGGDTVNWNHYCIAWDGTNVAAYFNGTNFTTVSIGAPYLRLTNDYNWVGIGCWTHNGTPQWGDDSYPNNGWLNGVVGETRLYDRALASTEVASLYAGTGAALTGSNPTPPASNTRTFRAQHVTVDKIQFRPP